MLARLKRDGVTEDAEFVFVLPTTWLTTSSDLVAQFRVAKAPGFSSPIRLIGRSPNLWQNGTKIVADGDFQSSAGFGPLMIAAVRGPASLLPRPGIPKLLPAR